MRRALLLGAAVLVLLVLAMLSVPARVVPGLLGPDQLRLSGVSGRAVSGRAARAMLPIPGGFFHLGELRWRLNIFSLLTFSPTIDVESDWARQRGSMTLRIAGSRMEIRDLDATIDASIVRQALPLSVSGRFEFLFDELIVDDNTLLSARGRLVWQDAGWQSGAATRALGSYLAVFSSPAEGEIEARIETLSGAVNVEGSAALLGRRYSSDLRVTPVRGGLDAELTRALSLVATPDENGYRLRLDGELVPVSREGAGERR